jgi:hypothetical protein
MNEHACGTFSFPARSQERAITDEELWILSYYRSSELAGSLLMGRLARKASDDELRARLTWHFAEEARHAWRWTEVIRVLGADPLPIGETYQSNYLARAGMPRDRMELLALTYVFERRAARHFRLHRQLEDVHPLIRSTLATMCAEEGPHLRWIKGRLDAEADRDGVAETLARYEAIDREVYRIEAERLAERGWVLPGHVLDELPR